MNHLKYILAITSCCVPLQAMHMAIPAINTNTAAHVPSLLPDPAGFGTSATFNEEAEAGQRVFALGAEVIRVAKLDPKQHADYKKRISGLLVNCNRFMARYGDKYPDVKTRLLKIAKKLS